MANKIRILQLITGLGIGGAEQVVFDLVANLDSDKFENTVVGITKINDRQKQFENIEVACSSLNVVNKLDFVGMFQAVFALRRIIKDKRINVIHAHMPHALFILFVLAFTGLKKPIVFTSHTTNVGSRFREFTLWVLQLFRKTDIIFSKNMKKWYTKNNAVIIPNSINIQPFKLDMKKETEFTFLAVGNLKKVKNHKLIIESAQKFKNKTSANFKIWIVGEGKERSNLEKQIERLNMQDHIILLGRRHDVPQLCNKAHAFLMASLWEGMPISLLEAGASSLPIISTPVGSIPSLINDKNGTLSSAEDYADNMIKLFQDYDKYKEKAQVLFDEIEKKYDIASFCEKHEKIYLNFVH